MLCAPPSLSSTWSACASPSLLPVRFCPPPSPIKGGQGWKLRCLCVTLRPTPERLLCLSAPSPTPTSSRSSRTVGARRRKAPVRVHLCCTSRVLTSPPGHATRAVTNIHRGGAERDEAKAAHARLRADRQPVAAHVPIPSSPRRPHLPSLSLFSHGTVRLRKLIVSRGTAAYQAHTSLSPLAARRSLVSLSSLLLPPLTPATTAGFVVLFSL